MDGRSAMSGLDELKTAIRRNMLLGVWAAEILGLAGQDADLYTKALAVGTVDPELNDVFSKIREDFHAAAVVETYEHIPRGDEQAPPGSAESNGRYARR
jgi:hypothetical protein